MNLVEEKTFIKKNVVEIKNSDSLGWDPPHPE